MNEASGSTQGNPLKPGTTTHGFTIEKARELPEIEGHCITGVHEPSGAKLLVLANDDPNKAFAIGFRTPPQDDTGVFHILEHSVLCGSERFPVKEPFVDLLKSSMQTFLNAMTFPDKTLYPVASTNDQDLLNLMDVYMDAVFHPQIYNKRTIFEQEGWHLELLDDPDVAGDPASLSPSQTELLYNGVVYNEMKGALSDAGSVLYDELQRSLLPDTCYAFESGGTPEAIPSLTYEGFLEDHRRHYRTDNSYIILYGNIDADRVLDFLDERYLTPVAEEQARRDDQRRQDGEEPLVPRTITEQKPLVAPFYRKTMDTAPENSCAAAAYGIGNATDIERLTAVDILFDALLGSNEAPLKRALLDRGIAHDVQSSVADSLNQPFAVIQLQMPAEGAAEDLRATIAEVVEAYLEDGLDEELIEASLSHQEFILRECDFGMADGVVYAMRSLASWLYDDDRPVDFIAYQGTFDGLRTKLGTTYYEDLLRELLCHNDHSCAVEIVPTPGQSDDPTPKILAAMNEKLTEEERERIVAEEATLRAIQEAPDDPKDRAKLPSLTLADIGPAPKQYPYGLVDSTPIPCLKHDIPTHGLAYAFGYYPLDPVAFEDLPYVSILALVLGKLDTAHHSAAELDTLVQSKLGGLAFFPEVFEDATRAGDPRPFMTVGASSLGTNADYLASIPREIMLETKFDDTDRIKDLLKQSKIAAEHSFISSGHSCASARARSYCVRAGVIREQLGNIGFYRFLCEVLEEFDARKDDLVQKLDSLARSIFVDRALISFAGDDASFDRYWASHPEPGRDGAGTVRLEVPAPTKRNEAFIIPSDVCYGATGWDWRLFGEHYEGSWLIAARALTYDYLWNEVRVKGGAYGVGFQATWAGSLAFYSYRDPHLDQTFARFNEAPSWLSSFEPGHEALDGLIISTVAALDSPMKPRALMRRQTGDHLAGRTPLEREALREEAIHTTADDLHDAGPLIADALEQDSRCVVGARSIIDGSKLPWDIQPLIG